MTKSLRKAGHRVVVYVPGDDDGVTVYRLTLAVATDSDEAGRDADRIAHALTNRLYTVAVEDD